MATGNPRLNVTVTPEQHQLLLELAKLNGGSAAGYLRQMLDQATPLLRSTVPALRMAADEMNTTRAQAQGALDDMLRALRDAGMNIQPDLLDDTLSTTSRKAGMRPQRSEDAAGLESGRK